MFLLLTWLISTKTGRTVKFFGVTCNFKPDLIVSTHDLSNSIQRKCSRGFLMHKISSFIQPGEKYEIGLSTAFAFRNVKEKSSQEGIYYSTGILNKSRVLYYAT